MIARVVLTLPAPMTASRTCTAMSMNNNHQGHTPNGPRCARKCDSQKHEYMALLCPEAALSDMALVFEREFIMCSFAMRFRITILQAAACTHHDDYS